MEFSTSIHHKELEAYFLLAGSTRYAWLVDGQLVTMDRNQGQWHFNYPNIPHAITTPLGKPHLSLWFREGGPGQKANNRFGPKWIGDTTGLDVLRELDEDGIADFVDDSAKDMHLGSHGFCVQSVFRADTDRFLRVLTADQFRHLQTDPNAMDEIDSLLTPEREGHLEQIVEGLALHAATIAAG